MLSRTSARALKYPGLVDFLFAGFSKFVKNIFRNAAEESERRNRPPGCREVGGAQPLQGMPRDPGKVIDVQAFLHFDLQQVFFLINL